MLKNILRLFTLIFFLLLISSQSFAQPISGAKTIPGDYASIQAAILALNANGVGSGGVTFTVAAGNTETTTDSLVLTVTGTSSDPIVFQTAGGGANPKITRTDAGTKATSKLGGQGDAVITLQGSDYITFDGIDVAADQATVEYGYYLRKAGVTDGCKYVTIKNSLVDLTKGTSRFVVGIYSSNNDAGTAIADSIGITVTTTGGRNEYVTLTGNTVQDVATGIYVKGYNQTAAPYDLQDFNFTIGTSGHGNTIRNFAGNVTAATLITYGILLHNHTNPTVSYNTIDNKGGGGVDANGIIYGIYMWGTAATNLGGDVVMNNNNITINQGSLGAVNCLTIAQNSNSMTVNNNTFSIGTFATTTGASFLINITGLATTKTVNGNQNSGLINKTVTGGSLTCLASSGAPVTVGTETFAGNKFSGITLLVTGNASFTGISVASSGTSTRYFNNNKISNITMGSGSFTGMSTGTILTEEVYNDTVMTASGTGSATGINCTSTQAGLLETVRDNYVTGLTFTGGSGTLIGIQTGGVSSTSTRYVYNNTVTNCSGGTGFQSHGINTQNILNQEIYNNTISGLSAGGNLNGLTFASQSSGLSTVYNNTVYDISTSGNSAVIGISNASAGITYFYKNSVSKLRGTNAGTTTTVRGIDVTIGYKNYVYNNLVSDLSAPSTTATGNVVMGINSTNNANTNTIYLYNNTVYVNSTGTTYKSYGIFSNSAHLTELRNNLVVNNSAGLAYAYGRTTIAGLNSLANYSLLSDNNNFYSIYRTYTDGTVTDTTISQFKTRAYPREQSSFAENSPFVNVATAPFDVHINTAIASQTESGGTPVTTPIAITNDYDGNIRNAATPDVGADEFSGITTDLTGPVISYSPLGYTGSLTDRTLIINISDRSGVPITSPGSPILYWKKNSDTTWTADTVDTVVGNNYTFTFGGGVTLNDTVFYYVAAQDGATTPNVRIVPTPGSGGYTSNPPAAATRPTNPDWYKISSVSLAGDYTVGVTSFKQITGRTITFERSGDKLMPMENGKPYTGDLYVKKAEHPEYNYPDNVQGVYTTLTSAVNDLNLRGVTAPVNFLLTDAVYDSTVAAFPLVINVINENLPTAVNQVTFKPNTGVTTKITHTLATNALIKVLSKYINIDGSNSGGTDRSLTIENSSASVGKVIFFGSVGTNPISWCTVKNCKLIAGSSAATDGYGVGMADTASANTAGYSNNITVQNNYITGAQGIWIYGPVVNNIIVTGNGSGITINGNTIDSTLNGGMYLNGLDNILVTNNTVTNTRGTSGGGGTNIYTNYVINSSISNNIIGPNSWVGGTVIGIRAGNNFVPNSNLLISGNIISGLLQPTSATVIGIFVEQNTKGVVVSNNRISNLKQSNATSRSAIGINVTAGVPNGDITIANNFIWDLASYGDVSISSNNAYGIVINSFTAGANGYKIYHNSVALTTNQTLATSNPACLNIQGLSATNPAAVDVRDNIFANYMTTGTNRYAVICVTPNTILANMNYNDYYVTPGSKLGRFGSTDIADITAWRTATGQDVNSIQANPGIVSPSDLHINTGWDAVDGKGTLLGSVTTDIDGQTRNNPPDIGADEYTYVAPNDPGLSATVGGPTQLSVSFTPNTSNDSVVVVWNTTGTFTTPAGAPPAAGQPFAGGTLLYKGLTSTVNHTGLIPNTAYYYKAFSYTNNYSAGVTANATTDQVSDPVSASASPVSYSANSVTFAPNAANHNVVVVWNLTGTFTTPSGAAPAIGQPFAGGTVLYNGITSPVAHTSLMPSTAYYYKLYTVVDTFYSAGIAVNATTLALPDPTTVSATAISHTQIDVAFTADSTHNVVVVWNLTGTFTAPTGAAPAVGQPFAGGELLYNGLTSPVNHTGLIPNTAYYYRLYTVVDTFYSSGVSANANTNGIADPTAVTATGVSSSQIDIAFTPDTTNNVVLVYNLTGTFTTPSGAPPAVGEAFAGGTLLLNGTTSPYNHTGLAPLTTYYYKLYTIQGGYYSAGVAVSAATLTIADPTAVTATAAGTTQVDVAFTPNASNHNVVVVWNITGTFTTPTGTPPAVGQPFAGGEILYNGLVSPVNHTGLTPNTTYYYMVYSNLDTIYSTGVAVNALTINNTFQLTVNINDGWNMVSVPGLHPVDQNVNTWWQYRDPLANVFKFATGYQVVTDAVPGTGYWMKHSGIRTYNTGEEWPAGGIQIVAHDPIPANSGWNIIGGYEQIVPTSGLTTTPAGLQTGLVYTYGTGYVVATSLEPGKGYWIALTGAGSINIPNALAKGQRPGVEYFPSDMGKIVFTDASGKSYVLYSAKEGADLNVYNMPPAPPAGMFDIRFGSQRIAEDLSGSQSIDMSGIQYPVSVRVENMDLRIQDETGKLVNTNVKAGQEITISSDIAKLNVTTQLLPEEYSLTQNYPNPFNPSTVIEFSLPQTSNVKLSIYNALGEKVAELVNSSLAAGKYDFTWNAGNFATGLYLYELRTDNFVAVKKMMLIK